MVVAERVGDSRTVARNTSDCKGYSAPIEDQVQIQHGSNVAEEPAVTACEVEPTKPVCLPLREPEFPVSESDASTSSPRIAVSTTPVTCSPGRESRLSRRERRKPVRFMDSVLY